MNIYYNDEYDDIESSERVKYMIDYSCNGILYTINKGDTLYNISKRYNVALSLIMRANQFVDIYNLQVGSQICIPIKIPMQVSQIMTYVIKDTDTLQSILKEFGITYDELLLYNDLQNTTLVPGMAIAVPTNVRTQSIETDEE